MPVSYDGKKLIPAPFVSIQRENVTREDGTKLSPIYSLTIRGKLLAYKGSPNSSGVLWTASGYPPDETVDSDSRLGAILRKQEALQVLFSEDGKSLEFQPWDSSAPMKCRPRIKRIEFPEGQWYESCDYVITVEADCVEGLVNAGDCDGAVRVNRTSEEWNLEVLDEARGTYRLTHSLSATGKRMFDDDGNLLDGKEAWEHARDYVLKIGGGANNGLGLGIVPARMEAPGVLDATSLQAFNYIRTQAINESAGVFSASETWVCYNPNGEPPAINDYTVSTRYSTQDNRISATIEGTITGFEVRDNNTHALTSTRWQNADSKWVNHVYPNLLSTVEATIGTGILNSLPLNNQTGMNPVAGTITYHWEYDNRPTPTTVGALTESITVQNSNAADVFAKVPVIGRPYGPVLQDMGTVTEKIRTINIEVLMPASTQSFSATQPNTDSIILLLMPTSTLGVFMEKDEETWSPNTGRYNRTTTFVWE